MALTEKTEVRIAGGVVAAVIAALVVWMHGRVNVIETENPTRDAQREQLQKESDKTADAIEAINDKMGDLKGDVREIRVMLEQRLTNRDPARDSYVP